MTLKRVQNDILRAMDDSKTTVLVLFDISAAFNTVDHNFLLGRLKQCGISGTSGMRIGHLIPRLKGCVRTPMQLSSTSVQTILVDQ